MIFFMIVNISTVDDIILYLIFINDYINEVLPHPSVYWQIICIQEETPTEGQADELSQLCTVYNHHHNWDMENSEAFHHQLPPISFSP